MNAATEKLRQKKAVLTAWAKTLRSVGLIDDTKCNKMIKMIEKIIE